MGKSKKSYASTKQPPPHATHHGIEPAVTRSQSRTRGPTPTEEAVPSTLQQTSVTANQYELLAQSPNSSSSKHLSTSVTSNPIPSGQNKPLSRERSRTPTRQMPNETSNFVTYAQTVTNQRVPPSTQLQSTSTHSSSTGSGIKSIDSIGIDKETNLRIAQMDGIVPETESFREIIANTSDNDDHNSREMSISTPNQTSDLAIQQLASMLQDLQNQMMEQKRMLTTLQNNALPNEKDTASINHAPMKTLSHHNTPSVVNISYQSHKTDENTNSNKIDPVTTAPKMTHSQEASARFNHNPFSLACSGKIKFTEIENALKTKVLKDDSQLALSLFYDSLIRSIGYAFDSQLPQLPSFAAFDRNTSFAVELLSDLHSTTKYKCENVYNRIGEIIKERLLNPLAISSETCPKAYRIIETNKLLQGWHLFEKLIKKRSVRCGAPSDIDLDKIHSTMELLPKETYHQFYQRNVELLHHYHQHSTDDDQIPTKKIIIRYVRELARVPAYISFLTKFIDEIDHHEIQYGPLDTRHHLPFTLDEPYELLERYNVPEIPPSLYPSRYLMADLPSNPYATANSSSTQPDSSNTTIATAAPIIAATEVDLPPPSVYCMQPEICAMTTQSKRCRACLLGNHDEKDCYLRGEKFRPSELNQRLNLFNSVHGQAPPQGHTMRKYQPKSVPPILQDDKSTSAFDHTSTPGKKVQFHQTDKSSNNRRVLKKPFKSSSKPSISQFDAPTHMQEDEIHDESIYCQYPSEQNNSSEFDPSINALVTEIDSFISSTELASSQNVYDDDFQPTICSFDMSHSNGFQFNSMPRLEPTTFPTNRTSEQPSSIPFGLNDNMPSNIPLDLSTPQAILDRVQQIHRANSYIPHAPFLRKLSSTIVTDLTTENFKFYCHLNFHLDSGANAFALIHRNLFYFYIENEQPVGNVNGAAFITPGWGGFVADICSRPHLITPAYHTPRNPRNTFSLSALKRFGNFHGCELESGVHLKITDELDVSQTIPIIQYNDLDFITIKILSHNRQPPQSSFASQVPEPLAPINPIIQEQQLQQLPRRALQLIAYYYVQLHDQQSPRTSAISKMNAILKIPTNFNPNISALESLEPIISPDAMYVPAMHNLYRAQERTMTPYQQYINVHLSLQHASKSTIIHMMKNNLMNHLPNIKHINDLACTCSICHQAKMNYLPRGPPADNTKYKPFQLLHLDFAFWGHTSIRGFTSSLDVTCAATSYCFGFPTKSATAPLDLITWVIRTLRKMGYDVLFIRVDEDQALAESSEFCEILTENSCILQTTAGANSSNNGKVEVSNRIKANMVRAMLAQFKILVGTNFPSDFDVNNLWCFAYQYANFVQRRLYNSGVKAIPYTLVHGTKPSFRVVVPFGAPCTTVRTDKKTCKKLDPSRSNETYFLGYGNVEFHHLVWRPSKPRQFLRSKHTIVEDIIAFERLQHLIVSPIDHPFGKGIKYYPASSLNNELDLPVLSPSYSPFKPEEIHRFEFDVPPTARRIGMEIRQDDNLNLPYIHHVVPNSPAHKGLPSGFRRNYYIISINGENPITVEYAADVISRMQKSKQKLVLELVHRGKADNSTSLALSRAMFDQMPNLLANQPIISMYEASIPDLEDHFVISPVKPETPKHFTIALKSNYRKNWIAAAYNQFTKNRSTAVFSLPFPISKIPENKKVLKTLLVCEVKATEMPMVWELRVRECVVGTPQEKGVDFPESYCAVVEATTYRLQIAVSSSLNYVLAIIDIKNAFQTTITTEEYWEYVRTPPLYLQWLLETEQIEINNPEDEILVRQMFNGCQGTKSASHVFYKSLRDKLELFGMKRSITDHGFFVYSFDDGTYMYMSTATDDLLTSAATYGHIQKLIDHLTKYFTLKIQKGKVLNFLGMRIIQTDKGISLDQAEYVYEMVHDFYNSDKLEKIKTVSTPLRSDNDFEKELYESPPQTDSEFAKACIEHRGSYRHHVGKILFASIMTRFDLCFAIQRLSEFNIRPNEVAWSGIARIMRYLAGDIIRPLFYPRVPLKGDSTITAVLTPAKEEKLTLSNHLNLFTDAEYARDPTTRHSYYCSVITFLGVAIHCKVKKTKSILPVNTTDSEIYSTYDGSKRLQPIKSLIRQMGLIIDAPTKTHIDNSATISVIASTRMTPRCRHLDIPIAYLHQRKEKEDIQENKISTHLQLADIGTKQLVPYVFKRQRDWLCGTRFYPQHDTEHFELLGLQFFEKTYIHIRDNTELQDEE